MIQEKSSIHFFLFFMILPYFVVPEDSFVYEYGSDNFRQQIEDKDGNFVLFYAPWCSHCTEFHPIWRDLAEMVNTKSSKIAIAQVDCTAHPKICQENDITGYPTLLYFHKNSVNPIRYKGTRDLPSITIFMSDIFNTDSQSSTAEDMREVRIYSGMAYLNDHNIEKFISKKQHFIMFFAPWCKASQKLAPIWAELGIHYALNPYIHVGKVNCMDSEVTCSNFDINQYPYLLWIVNGRIAGVAEGNNIEDLKAYVERMLLTEHHDPEKFMKKQKALPVARISEETFETFMEKDLVFVNYFAPWCAHCMQLNPLWVKLGEKFQNETRVLIADVDCVRSKPICETEKINNLPTLILYKQKKIVNVDHGGRPLDSLIRLVNEHLKTASEETTAEEKPTKDEL